MRLKFQTKIRLTVIGVVAILSLFMAIFFPAREKKLLEESFDRELYLLAETVALGVNIGLKSGDLAATQSAFDFSRADPRVRFVALVSGGETIAAHPHGFKVSAAIASSDTQRVERAAINSEAMQGEIIIGCSTAKIVQSLSTVRLTALGAGLGALLGGVLSALWLARSVNKPVKALRKVAEKIAIGDIDTHESLAVDFKTQDEIGALGTAFGNLVSYINGVAGAAAALSKNDRAYKVVPRSERDALSKNFITISEALYGMRDEIGALVGAAQEGKLRERGRVEKFQGIYRELVQGINQTLEAVVGPIEETASVLDQVAKRNLSVRMQGQYQGDFAKLKEACNTAIANLNEGLTHVAVGAEQVAAASSEISSGSQALAQSASEQASSLQETSSSLQEMASMTKQSAANAKEAKSMVDGARASAEKGMDSMSRLSQAIGKIKESSDQTGKIVKTIDEIAFQTNLLALNAAVEAARAGETGKGFAVVAEEVRNLAMRSAEAAKNTASLIEASAKNAEGGVAINQEVLKNLQEIGMQVNKVSEVMAELAAASDQQSQGVDQITTAVEQMNQVTQQTAASAEESASAAQELSSQSAETKSLVSSFKLTNVSESVRGAGAAPLRSSGVRVVSKADLDRGKGKPAARRLEARKLIALHDEDRAALEDF
jgi:methyl-accepting chemotaxis protein